MKVFRIDAERAIVIDLVTFVEILAPSATYEWAFGWRVEAHFVGDGRKQVFSRPHRHRIGGSQYALPSIAAAEDDRATLEVQDELDARVLYGSLLAAIEQP